MRLPKRLGSSLSQQSKERASVDGEPSLAPQPFELAPRWHTVTLISLILAVFVTGSLLTTGSVPSRPSSMPRLTGVYLPLLAVEWGLALYVVRIGRPHSALRDLLGKGWNDLGRACADLALAMAIVAIILAGELLTRHWFVAAHNAARDALLPTSAAETATWLVLAVSAGFCEELVYRGYLLTQLRAFSGSLTLACGAQAALFGLAHAEQGSGVALRFGLYALLLGVLASWRRSLVPGILAHVALDVSAGFLR